MNAFEKAIYTFCGVRIEGIPADGKSRSFPIGNQEGFAMYFGDCGAFGNATKNQTCVWDGKKARLLKYDPLPPKLKGRALEEEQRIVDIGNAMYDRGEVMAELDADRYILALSRVIEAKHDGSPL